MRPKEATVERIGNPIVEFHGEVQLVGRKPIVITNELGKIVIRQERIPLLKRIRRWLEF